MSKASGIMERIPLFVSAAGLKGKVQRGMAQPLPGPAGRLLGSEGLWQRVAAAQGTATPRRALDSLGGHLCAGAVSEV